MPNYIVLRLTPSSAVDAATFATYLNNLTVNVYDISYAQPTAGTLIGSAGFVAPAFPPAATTHIVQHAPPPTFTLEAVATALIAYPGGVPEYLGPDLRVEFVRGGGQPIADPQLYYNVTLQTIAGAFPPPASIQAIADTNVSAFSTLSSPTNNLLTLATDGSPPKFDVLLAAVTAVLTSDPAQPVTPVLLGNLSVNQCANIAKEIIYGPQAPLPTVPESLSDMFTNPPNKGGFGDTHEQNRLQFEGQLSGYYGQRDAKATRLTGFIYALAAAEWCELQTQAATSALITFPVNPNTPQPPLATMAEAQVIFTGALGLDVPAAYFYALTYDLPVQVTRESRQQLVLGTGAQANLNRLKAAVGADFINVSAAMNPAQAARILQSLYIPPATTVPAWSVGNPSAAQIFQTDWLQFPSAATWTTYKFGDETGFWQTEATAHPAAFLDLVLFVLTQGYMIGPNSLADEIKLHLLAAPLASVSSVANSTPADWQRFFTTLPAILGAAPDAVLPPLTLPGSVSARIAAFITAVQRFFQLGTAAPALNPVAAIDPRRFGVPAYDVIARTILNYAGFFLGIAINPATLEAAALAAAGGDERVQAWAVQAVQTLNELFILSQIPGQTAAFDFAVMEALFARGFTNREDVLDHAANDFQQALTGTVAYDFAAVIYANAGPPNVFPPPGGPPFGPINPGCLTDCIPPLELSPLGPVAYLNEMLRVSERSTCDRPFAPPATGHTTLQALIDQRRGPVETLAVTRANLETPLPLIDIVNECLQFMAATMPPTQHGTVYDTSGDALAGFKLCDDHCDHGCEHHDCGCEPDDCECHEDPQLHKTCHEPAVIFDALPEYSTPATPVPANSAVVPSVWNRLKSEFSSCCLPYDQALDVNRTYLDHFRSCRFEEMRTFRKCITELALDPINQPADFQSHLWRYPVRLDIAIEYLGISREEYTTLFQGIMPGPCDGQVIQNPIGVAAAAIPTLPPSILACLRRNAPASANIQLPEFLECMCLTYCEFFELWKSKFVAFSNGGDRTGDFPECEPCCLDEMWLRFPEEEAQQALPTLIIFIRLWLKLRHLCGAGYSFVELADICTVLGFPGPDFIRQLAAFQMLRDQFRLKLTGRDPPAPGATGANRTFLLALWAGPSAAQWQWAVRHLLHGIAYHARCRHECEPRAPEFIKLLEDNLDPLSRLAGFDPALPTDTWHAVPTHTLRYAEVLSKIYASNFSIGEILFLFTADIHLDGDDPFPLQDANEAHDSPLGLPDEEHEHSLWHLRRRLLDVHASEEAAEHWSWRRVEAALTHEFGFPGTTVSQLGEHFFPDVLEQSGVPVGQAARRFAFGPVVTVPQTWNSPPVGPFRYNVATQQVWAVLPIHDAAVLEQLARVPALSLAEQHAVQDVYFQPRLMLSTFAMLFDDFDEAQRRLIEGASEERWDYFRRQFARAHRRCEVVADHLSEHVEAATGQERPEGSQVARLILRDLFGDENESTLPAWENDHGNVPPVTWTPPANGGAYAALLGLAGTGLDGEFTTGGGPVVWREIRDALRPFGHVPDRENCPVPTVIPSMGLTLTASQMKYVTVRNGLAMDDTRGEWLGGAQGFEASWRGALLVDRAGDYHFRAGAPAEGDEEPSPHEAHHRSWRVVLQRGQKRWVLLRHGWHHEENLEPAAIRLERGAYDLSVEFIQHPPEYLHEDEVRRQHTGFEIKYRGPDTDGQLAPISPAHLFRTHKDGPLSVAGLSGSPAEFLRNRYDSSLRDIRRTYQRAFKALLFAHRFALSARRHGGEGSELGYMLANAGKFAGWSYYRNGGVFTTHKADFDFDFLPVGDPYFVPAADDRANPSHKRIEALFDWWERVFDYSRVRREVNAQCHRRLWLLWVEAHDKQPVDPSSLLRHMCSDARHWSLDLHFFQDQAAPVYAVTSADLEDDRWTVRAWHADRWLRHLWKHFTVKDITQARPDLWASDDPAALIPGEAETGNANLLHFLCDGCFGNGAPRRYDDVRRLNDGLRERGRDALICYLCGPTGIAKSPNELSETLLLDVLAGRCEKASRIEEAVSAVQTFVRRARLGLEPGWTVSGAFAHLWNCRFISYHVWQACKRRELYKENWIDWHEHERAETIEAFGFLNEQLKRATLTIATPGGVDFWPDQLPPSHPGLCLLQRRDPAEMRILPAAREGLNLLATPERDARPSWITTVPDLNAPLPAAAPAAAKLPFWMECAIRLGTRFVRLAAAAYPPASTDFSPRHECEPESLHGRKADNECCVTCCEECGCEHPAYVDEYYFWLIEAQYFDPETQPVYSNIFDGQQKEFYDQNVQVATPWHDVTQLPGLLEWPPEPMVRLAWCRVHNGEFKQPRRSVWGIPYSVAAGVPDLAFKGRVGDSLYFEVTNPGNVGFRYDMVPDSAKELDSLVLPLAPPPPPPPAGLVAYPYFVYFEPGARLFPWSLFSPSIAVAHALRAHCRFEAALKWYELVYNPLNRDNRWALCEIVAMLPTPGAGDVAGVNTIVNAGDVAVAPAPEPGCCCDTTDITCRDARHRSILLHYLETLLEWGDALMRRNSPEAFHQARLVFDTLRRIMGRHPQVVKNPAHPAQTVATFQPLWAPINPRLMTLYDQLDDRLGLIHQCLSLRRLAEMPRKCGDQYWGDDPVRGWRSTLLHPCCDTDGSCRPCSPYRFTFRIQKAKELAAQTRELGNALLAAFEKGDGEFLASVRARQEHELAQLNRKVREDLWRDADWQVQAVEKSKESLQSSRRYYANLIANGLNAHENGYVDMTNVSMDDHAAANILEGIAEAMDIVPDIFVGTVDYAQIPIGTKLAGLFKTIARITNTLADVANSTAGLDVTEAGWDRRLQDWVHQVEVLDIQIEQTELQVLGAERRRDQSVRDLNIQERQIEQASETLDFLRDKFSNHAVYLFLQKQTADLHHIIFELALNEAREAEHAFNFERGHTTQQFIGRPQWDNLHEGLMAGDRLQAELARMEKEYFDHNCREYELTKHISLRLSFPLEFLRLKLNGWCEIEIPEWMFDLDYPGHYMRRIKTVSLTIPAVAGPYNEVHCRLTLLRSGTRIAPLPRVPAAVCCDCCQSKNGYPVCPHDTRWVTQNGALEAIATSTGQDDAGLFQVSFQDERYLPFEYHGAVSRWRIEMPPENNYFDMESLSDLMVNISYTAREGGEALRRAAREASACDLPGAGWCLFDLRHDFADSWELFHRERHDDNDDERRLEVRFRRSMFPFVPGDRELFIETIALLFDRPDHCGCECPAECPCCSDPAAAHHELVLRRHGADERRFGCVISEHWPSLHYGIVDGLCIGPLAGRREREPVALCFPDSVERIESAYLLCRYSLKDECCTALREERGEHDPDRFRRRPDRRGDDMLASRRGYFSPA
jgi:hypothetical protein